MELKGRLFKNRFNGGYMFDSFDKKQSVYFDCSYRALTVLDDEMKTFTGNKNAVEVEFIIRPIIKTAPKNKIKRKNTKPIVVSSNIKE